MANDRHVVVTGIGTITPGAKNYTELWDRIIAQKSYISRVEDLEIAHKFLKKEGIAIGARFDEIKLKDHIECSRLEENYDNTTKIAILCADSAMKDAGTTRTPDNTAVFIGSARGNARMLERKVMEIMNAIDKGVDFSNAQHVRGASLTSSSSIASAVSRRYHFKGTSRTIGTACTSSLNAIGDAYRHIKYGESDTALAGGAEAALTTPMYIWFNLGGIYASAKSSVEESVRPFSKTRDGTAIGEMGAILLLEEENTAKRRGAKIYGEIVSFADAIDAGPKSLEALSPDGRPYTDLITETLRRADVPPSAVDFVLAHGTGTVANDKIELIALENIYAGTQHPPTTSLKAITGHGVGACAALETAVALLAMKKSIIPPNTNLNDPEIISESQNLPITAQTRHISYALKMGSGFGGYLSALLLKNVRE